MKLELYHFEECPYCAKVRTYIERAGIQKKIVFHDIDLEPHAFDRLMQLNDDDQVPCLVIDGKPLLESDDIIAWLKENVKP